MASNDLKLPLDRTTVQKVAAIIRHADLAPLDAYELHLTNLLDEQRDDIGPNVKRMLEKSRVEAVDLAEKILRFIATEQSNREDCASCSNDYAVGYCPTHDIPKQASDRITITAKQYTDISSAAYEYIHNAHRYEDIDPLVEALREIGVEVGL